MDLGARHHSVDARENSSDSAAPSAAQAERELSDRYSQRLRFFVSRRIHDTAAAEDIAQETLQLVVNALREGKIENLAALPGFVFSTARNLCLHWVRSAARENSALQRFHSGVDRSPESRDVLTSLINEDRCKVVRAALNKLPSGDRDLLSLLFYKGLSAEEAAESLSITPAAARVRKHRALQRLAQLLGEVGDGNKTSGAGTLD